MRLFRAKPRHGIQMQCARALAGCEIYPICLVLLQSGSSSHGCGHRHGGGGDHIRLALFEGSRGRRCLGGSGWGRTTIISTVIVSTVVTKSQVQAKLTQNGAHNERKERAVGKRLNESQKTRQTLSISLFEGDYQQGKGVEESAKKHHVGIECVLT
jgi:hypothetical protein